MTFHRYDLKKWWSNGYDHPYEKVIPWSGTSGSVLPYGLDPALNDQVAFFVEKLSDDRITLFNGSTSFSDISYII